MFIATLIAKERLTRGDISAAADALGGVAGEQWIEDGHACDLQLIDSPTGARAALEGLLSDVDVVVQPAAHRRKRLLVADMDSTMITVECIDELADYAGLKAEVAEVTERAMRGELDFEAALDARVALLKGLDEAAIDRCRAERVRLAPGARALVRTMRANGAYALLVSGGFTRFAGPVAEEIGFDAQRSNILEVEAGRLTGTVARPIVGAAAKRESLLEAAASRAIPLDATLAVGDGANDIPMIEAAGLGVAYHAKPATAAAADARIEANDLTALLYAQGYARKDWVEA
ncbi:phosphoserine phosphatase SerB [Sphingosinicella sp. LHD-64]|uniref:phosphoserine phosphatase SerB n=1 Tax=Sphingosinicella sp. LHD-64 TaxID=3072139 RepID=UPI00280D7A15|nr:phosphoserine phosphatase SerB [Sphingosinicella sp. LHD-64]MDQ8755275.1 phosphoserine phosphatase SerB [Sphingosinicella sp. LHD-64]